MNRASEQFSHLTPTTKEEYLYRSLFEGEPRKPCHQVERMLADHHLLHPSEFFPGLGMPERTVECWQAGLRFGNSNDPSGHLQ